MLPAGSILSKPTISTLMYFLKIILFAVPVYFTFVSALPGLHPAEGQTKAQRQQARPDHQRSLTTLEARDVVSSRGRRTLDQISTYNKRNLVRDGSHIQKRADPVGPSGGEENLLAGLRERKARTVALSKEFQEVFSWVSDEFAMCMAVSTSTPTLTTRNTFDTVSITVLSSREHDWRR